MIGSICHHITPCSPFLSWTEWRDNKGGLPESVIAEMKSTLTKAPCDKKTVVAANQVDKSNRRAESLAARDLHFFGGKAM